MSKDVVAFCMQINDVKKKKTKKFKQYKSCARQGGLKRTKQGASLYKK